MARERDTDWDISKDVAGRYSYEAAHLAVLMDLRDRLDRVLNVLECHNVQQIPKALRAIVRNTARYRCSCPRTFETPRGLRQHMRIAHPERAR